VATSESRVKEGVKKYLFEMLGGFPWYAHWPVLNGMGTPEIDCNLVVFGRPYAIECKAPGKKPTTQQWDTLTRKRDAGVYCVIVGGVFEEFRGRPIAHPSPIDLRTLGALLRAPEDRAHAQTLMDENWKRYGGTYGRLD
jgi:hypothetical protein